MGPCPDFLTTNAQTFERSLLIRSNFRNLKNDIYEQARAEWEAGTANIYHRRFAQETNFEKCFSWNFKPKPGLLAADQIPFYQKLLDANAHLPRGFHTRRRHDSGRGERLSGVIDLAVTVVHAPVRDFARILRFPLAKCASRRCALWGSSHGGRVERPNLNIWFSSRDSYQRRKESPINGLG